MVIHWKSFRGRQEEKWGSFRGGFGDHFRAGDHFGDRTFCPDEVSLRSKRFRGVSAQISMFWPRENWGESKKERGGGGEEKRKPFPFLLSPSPLFLFCSRPNFRAAKTSKFERIETLGTRLRKRLLRRLG